MKVKIEYEPHPNQDIFHMKDCRFRAFIGGIGSGKTLAGCHEAFDYMMKNPGSLGIITAPTYPMLRDATMRTFFEIVPEVMIEEFLKIENRLKLKNGSEVLFRSTDDPEKLRGPNLSWFYMDEAAMSSRMAWKILVGRIRQKFFPHYGWLTSTPKGFNWIYEEFVERKDKRKNDYFLVKTSSKENPYLDKKFIESLEESYNGVFAKQEIEGEFVGSEGLVYSTFNRESHVVDNSFDIGNFREYIYGCDFGFSNPTAVVVVGVTGDDEFVVVDEVYEKKLLIEDVIKKFDDFYKKYGKGKIYCDPSEPAYIEQMSRAGLVVDKGFNEILPGINFVSSKLKVKENDRPSLIVKSNCVNMIAEFENYRYPDDKEGKPMIDKPLKVFDHLMDALRYALYSSKNQGKGFYFLDGSI